MTHTLRCEAAIFLSRESVDQVTNTITPQIEAAEEALDALGKEEFPNFHAVTDGGERSLTTVVSRSFNVLQLMHGLGLPIGAEHQYRPGVFEAQCTRKEYEAVNAIVASGRDWDGTEPDDWPLVSGEFGGATTQAALDLLNDAAEIGDLCLDYFFLEQKLARQQAQSTLARYAQLLRDSYEAFRIAGWD